MEDILLELIEDLSEYNDSHMLSGYLDSIAKQYNPRLIELGLPTIKLCGEHEQTR